MSYYKRHIFFCCNERPEDAARPCCMAAGADEMRQYAKQRVKDMGLSGPVGGVRVNKSGCLDRCEEGPTAVVYPDAVWYSYRNKHDIDEIVEQHLRDGEPVTRLMI